MTFREQVLKVFRREPLERLVFQPRLESWYYSRLAGKFGGLPESFGGKDILEVYDSLGCSLRTYRQFNPCLVFDHSSRVRHTYADDGVNIVEEYSTPVGRVEMRRRHADVGARMESWFVKHPDDLRALEYVVKDRKPRFDMETYQEQNALVGNRAEPMICLPRVNLMRLIVEWVGFENTIFALSDARERMEGVMRAIDESDDAIMHVIAESPIQIINFGDNIDANLASPPLFRRYILPAYHRRLAILRPAGKFCHAHFDGRLRPLLPLFRETGLLGLEALTPRPQGDVSIEEMKQAMGDMILIDGIPMLLFLPRWSVSELERCALKLIELFAPNLILGVSDEISPTCDIERVRFIAELVRRQVPARAPQRDAPTGSAGSTSWTADAPP